MYTGRPILASSTIAVPESRQLDVMAAMLENRGATVIRVPMISILDSPHPEQVEKWIRDFISQPPELFIILTGEGVRRLISLAKGAGLQSEFLSTLSTVKRLCRGPKPVRALREIGLGQNMQAQSPTTDGVIETLKTFLLKESRVAVQLYGEEPNLKLMDFLQSRDARVTTVAPYVYADRLDEEHVVKLIRDMAAGKIDVITFTSQPQFKRLRQVAGKTQLIDELLSGLARTTVAVVGPVVREQLEKEGIRVDVMPAKNYFMKPLVIAISRFLQSRKPASKVGA